jgi:hypothetical protein
MQKKTTPRGRPSKGESAKAKVIQVRVDATLERHVKAEGGSAFVRDLIVKSMKKSTTPKKTAIVNGPKPQAVSDAMKTLKSKTAPAKTKELAGEVGDYRKAAIKEGAKPEPSKVSAKKPDTKASATKPAAKSKAPSSKKK